ncbi:MAG: response regulator [Planctomycetota bacterium]
MTDDGRNRTEEEKPRVLVVDDDPSVRRLIVEILEGNNRAECSEASSVLEAIDRICEGRIDAVVADVLLREGGGRMLFAHLEREDKDLSRRIVFVTGLIETPEVESICHDTGNILLRKPFLIGEFLEAIDEILARG